MTSSIYDFILQNQAITKSSSLPYYRALVLVLLFFLALY
nr:MAG TPA: hypothetical protein [Caudoviricetes sp.]